MFIFVTSWLDKFTYLFYVKCISLQDLLQPQEFQLPIPLQGQHTMVGMQLFRLQKSKKIMKIQVQTIQSSASQTLSRNPSLLFVFGGSP